MTISLEVYVPILLAISAVSMYFIFGVLLRQISLMRAPFENVDEYDEYTKNRLINFRRVLFAIALTIIIMGMIPVVINIIALLIDTGRPREIQPISFIYSMGVHLQGLLLSYLVSRLYKLASNQKEATDFTQHQLEKELKSEKRK
jgi:hypothetical protein